MPRRPIIIRCVIAITIVVALVAAVAWWAISSVGGRRATSAVNSAQPKQIKEVKPVVVSKSAAVPEVAAKTVKSKTKAIPRRADGSIDWTKIKPHELPPEMVGHDPEPAEPVRPVFSNSADQVIAMVISTPPDVDLPPIVGLGDDLEAQFFKSFEQPVTVGADDSPEIKELKENLIATKKQILEMIDKGMTVSQVLQEHQEVFNQNRRDFLKSQRVVDEYFEAGDLESAKAYIEKANPILESMGAPLLQMPMTRAERIAERRAQLETLRSR